MAICHDAHADAARAHEDAEISAAGNDFLDDGLSKIVVVDRILRRSAEIGDNLTATGEVSGDGLFQFQAGVIGADGEAKRTLGRGTRGGLSGRRSRTHGWVRFVDEFKDSGNGFEKGIATRDVRVETKADGIRDVDPTSSGGVKVGNEPNFVLSLGKIESNCLKVTPSHHEDVSGPFDEIFVELLAALPANIDAEIPARFHRGSAWGLAIEGADASGRHLDISPVLERRTQEPFRHGTAANIPGADEKDVFHFHDGWSEGSASYELTPTKSTGRGTNHLSARQTHR